jgi:aspartate/glutamate racemase
MKNKKYSSKIIGIIGGMGPQASARLYDLIIQKVNLLWRLSE